MGQGASRLSKPGVAQLTDAAGKVYPITEKQAYFLNQAEDPRAPEDLIARWTMYGAILLHPRVDLRRLRRAVQKLALRHDILRLRFIRIRDEWRGVIDPPEVPMVRQVHLGDVDESGFRAALQAEAGAYMRPTDERLFEVVVMDCGARGDALILKIHHSICDGFGVIVLTEDLVKLMLGLPLEGGGMPFGTYMARHARPLPSKMAEATAFWDEMHRDFPPAPNVGRKAKGLEPLHLSLGEVDADLMRFNVTPASMTALETRMEARNMTPAAGLIAAYSEALCDLNDLDRLAFHAHFGRSDPALGTFIGDHTTTISIIHNRAGEARMDDAIVELKTRMTQAMDYLPFHQYGRGTAFHQALIDGGGFPDQFAVSHPSAMVRTKRSPFSTGFFAKDGEEHVVGPFKATTLTIPFSLRMTYELQLKLDVTERMTGFGLQFDRIAYTDDEIQRLGARMASLLGLDLSDCGTP